MSKFVIDPIVHKYPLDQKKTNKLPWQNTDIKQLTVRGCKNTSEVRYYTAHPEKPYAREERTRGKEPPQRLNSQCTWKWGVLCFFKSK